MSESALLPFTVATPSSAARPTWSSCLHTSLQTPDLGSTVLKNEKQLILLEMKLKITRTFLQTPPGQPVSPSAQDSLETGLSRFCVLPHQDAVKIDLAPVLPEPHSLASPL